jgi:hypothetical protein
VFDGQGLAELIKFMPAAGLAFPAGKEPVGKLLAVVGQDFGDLDRTSRRARS